MKLKKVDGRMSGYNSFPYCVELPGRTNMQKFVEIRQWCWDTWGPSCELDIWQIQEWYDQNNEWCWLRETAYYKCRIYLGSEQAAALFTLKWI